MMAVVGLINRMLPLLPAEEVLWSSPATRCPPEGLSVGGTTYLTSLRFAFVPNRLSPRGRIWATDTSAIKACSVVPPRGIPYNSLLHSLVAVQLADGEQECFRTADPANTVSELSRILRLDGVAG